MHAPRRSLGSWLVALRVGVVVLCVAASAHAAASAASSMPWWFWPLVLFAACFLMGIAAVPAGIGGGTLFVPIIGGFFPFHLDFVRVAGLLVALASAFAAGPMLLRSGLAVLASASSIIGAPLGIALPASVLQTALGSSYSR